MTTGPQANNMAFNAVNRGLYVSDNLPFLRSLNDDCVDLVCIDPPFAKNDSFNRADNALKPPLDDAEKETESRLLRRWGATNQREAEQLGIEWPERVGSGFTDIWSWEKDVHEEWLESIEADYPAIYAVIQAASNVRNDGTDAYLCFMAIRLIEIRRVLKPTGSLFLHCDHTANSYLRQLLDAIFGAGRFRSEIIWKSANPKGNTAKRFHNNVDTILYYTKSDEFFLPTSFTEYEAEDTERRFSGIDDDGGCYQTVSLRDPGRRGGHVYEWNGHRERWRWPKERMQEAHDQGRLHYSGDGMPRSKSYLDESDGVPLGVLWTDISPLNSMATERTGYSTQKPVELARRIISASTNHGDVVLDCFAGCAYTAVAAEMLKRKWVACDINPRAWTVFKRQFNKPGLVLLKCNDDTIGQQVIGTQPVVTVHGPNQLPERTSPVSDIEPPTFKVPERKFKVPASIIPESEMLNELLRLSEYKAWCCGFANRKPDGAIIETSRNFHLDHIDPKSKQGSNQITNRAPLCPHHNIRKGNKRIHLADYRQEIAYAGEMMVSNVGELIDLAWAYDKALDIYHVARQKREGGRG